jgi:hypothetical protein
MHQSVVCPRGIGLTHMLWHFAKIFCQFPPYGATWRRQIPVPRDNNLWQLEKIFNSQIHKKRKICALSHKTAADHTFFNLASWFKMQGYNSQIPYPCDACYCQITDPGEAGSCQNLWEWPIPPPPLGQTADCHWCITLHITYKYLFWMHKIYLCQAFMHLCFFSRVLRNSNKRYFNRFFFAAVIRLIQEGRGGGGGGGNEGPSNFLTQDCLTEITNPSCVSVGQYVIKCSIL